MIAKILTQKYIIKHYQDVAVKCLPRRLPMEKISAIVGSSVFFFFSLVLFFAWSKVSIFAGKVKQGKMLFDSIEGKEIVAAVDAPK